MTIAECLRPGCKKPPFPTDRYGGCCDDRCQDDMLADERIAALEAALRELMEALNVARPEGPSDAYEELLVSTGDGDTYEQLKPFGAKRIAAAYANAKKVLGERG
mgnify:CR=1 FL=1|jgi:hypothetical protein